MDRAQALALAAKVGRYALAHKRQLVGAALFGWFLAHGMAPGTAADRAGAILNALLNLMHAAAP